MLKEETKNKLIRYLEESRNKYKVEVLDNLDPNKIKLSIGTQLFELDTTKYQIINEKGVLNR